MANINTLPNDAFAQVLLNLEQRDRDALATACTATRNLHGDGRVGVIQAYTAEVQQIIEIANRCLVSIRNKQAADNDGGEATPMSPTLHFHMKSAEKNVALLQSMCDGLGHRELPPHVPESDAQALQDAFLAQDQQHIAQIVNRLLAHIHRMDPATTCFAELDRGEYCFLRRHLNRIKPECTLPPYRVNAAIGLAGCMKLAKNGQMEEAIATAFQIQNQIEQIQALSLLSSDLLQQGQMSKVVEIFDRLITYYPTNFPFETVTYFQRTWDALLDHYRKQEDVGTKQEQMGLLLKYMCIGFKFAKHNAISYTLDDFPVGEVGLLLTHLKKLAKSPSLSPTESKFIEKAYVALFDMLCQRRDLTQAACVLNEIRDEKTLKETVEYMDRHSSEVLKQIVITGACTPRVQTIVLEALIQGALDRNKPDFAQELIALSVDLDFRSHAHFLLAKYYLRGPNMPIGAFHVPQVERATELLESIFDDYEHLHIINCLIEHAMEENDFDRAIAYASSLIESPDLIPKGKDETISRSTMFKHIIQKMRSVQRTPEWFARVALLLNEISHQGDREAALNSLLDGLYFIPGQFDEVSDRVVLDQILQLDNETIQNELLAHFVMRKIASRSHRRSRPDIFQEAASRITNADMRRNMLVLIDVSGFGEFLDEENKEDGGQ